MHLPHVVQISSWWAATIASRIMVIKKDAIDAGVDGMGRVGDESNMNREL